MQDKFNLEMLRKAVGKKLEGLNESRGTTPVRVHAGSHSRQRRGEELQEGESSKIKQSLFQLAVYAAKLHDLLEEGKDIEEAEKKKIVESIARISEVYHTLEYRAYNETE